MLIKHPSSNRSAYTLIELLAVLFMIAVTGFIEECVTARFGRLSGILAGAIGLALSFGLVCLFYCQLWKHDKTRLRKLREKYRGIYRVLALPSNNRVLAKPESSEIRIGDYGWEAEPRKKDGCIYLQGLTKEWTVVWHAGFRPEQIEWIKEKTSSQYDYWIPHWIKESALIDCPFPIIDRPTLTLGRPHHSHRYFVLPLPYPSKKPH